MTDGWDRTRVAQCASLLELSYVEMAALVLLPFPTFEKCWDENWFPPTYALAWHLRERDALSSLGLTHD